MFSTISAFFRERFPKELRRFPRLLLAILISTLFFVFVLLPRPTFDIISILIYLLIGTIGLYLLRFAALVMKYWVGQKEGQHYE